MPPLPNKPRAPDAHKPAEAMITRPYVKGTVDHINTQSPPPPNTQVTSHDLTTKEYLDKGNILLTDDHDKTCKARYAECNCGYEARLESYIEQALAEIVRLNEEIVALKKRPIGTQP